MKKRKLWSIVVAGLVCILAVGWFYWDNYIRCPEYAEKFKAALIIKATQAANELLVTRDFNTYMTTMQEINQALAYLPRSCIDQPGLHQPADSQCAQLWSDFDWCEREYKMCIASGNRRCSYNCWKPKCSR